MRAFRRIGGLTVATIMLMSLVPAAASANASVSTSANASAVAGGGNWQRLATTGEAVSERSAPVAVGMNHRMYVFGGAMDDFSTGQATFYNDLHRFDLASRTWTRLTPAGQTPPARAFAAGSAQPSTQRLFVFGGSTFDVQGTQFEPFGDLWAYSAATNRWSPLLSTTAGPSARSGATMWTVGDQLFVFGGIDATFTTLNELWRYDLRRSRWAQVTVYGAAPPGRHVAQAGVPAFGQLTLYGGEAIDPQVGFVVLGDTWEYDVARNRWREVTPASGNIDPARNYGAAAVIGSGLYLHGGDIPGGSAGCGAPFPQNPTDELWRFDLVHHTWQQLDPGGSPLVRLKRHAAATVDGRMLVVAGWDFQCDNGVGPGQVWNLHTYAFTPS